MASKRQEGPAQVEANHHPLACFWEACRKASQTLNALRRVGRHVMSQDRDVGRAIDVAMRCYPPVQLANRVEKTDAN